MARPLSNKMLREIFSANSADPFLFLVTITPPTGSGLPVYNFVNNREQVTSNGVIFSPFAMRLTLPVEDGETVPVINLEVDNVDLEVITTLRRTINPFRVELKAVLASQPNIIELTVSDLIMSRIVYNDSTITANLVLDDLINTGIPNGLYSPFEFPSMFK